MEDKKIYACVDGSKFSESVCDYSIAVAKRLGVELKFLNTIEHSHISKKQNLSGNIGLGSRDSLLESLSNEEALESKDLISRGKDALRAAKERATSSGYTNITSIQRHGSLYENLIDLEDDIRVLVIGFSGEDRSKEDKGVGKQVEEIIRSLHVPTLLVNREFDQIKKVLIAYDGSEPSKKALEMVAKNPIFGEVERFLVSVNQDENILESAKEHLKSSNIEANIFSLKGDPLVELLKFQEEKEIDIIAMGAFSHSRIKGALFGSFTHKMLLNVKTPLLLLR